MNFILFLIFKDDRNKKEITLPTNCTIYHLRLKALEEFNIRNSDIELLIGSSNQRINPDIEEEYSISQLGNIIFFKKNLAC